MERKPITRRELLRVAALAAAGTTLAACAGAPAATPAPQPTPQVIRETVREVVTVVVPQKAGPGLIRLSVWGDVPDRTVYDQITDRFNETHADVKALPEQYLGGYYQKIQANFAGGNSADVLYFQGWSWQPYADKDQLLPLDDLIKRDNFTGPWPDLAVHNNYSKWHGRTYMNPADSGAVVMFYNKALFDKRGVPYPKDNWTWEDFQAIVEKMSFEEGGVKYFGFAQAGGWMGGFTRSYAFVRKDGLVEWDRMVEPQKAQFSQQGIADALQWVVYDTIKNGWCPSPANIQGGGIALSSGRVALTNEGPWYLPQMYGEKERVKGGIPFDVVEPPKGKANKMDLELSTSGQVIYKGTKSPDAAWELIKLIGSDDGQKLVAGGGRQCGTPEMMAKWWVPTVGKKFNFTRPEVFQRAMEVKDAHGVMVGGAGANWDAALSPVGGLQAAWDAIVGLQKTAKDALVEADGKLNKMFDEYWKNKK